MTRQELAYSDSMRIDQAEEQAVLEVLRSKRLFRYYGPNPGPSRVEEFETTFSQLIGSRYAVAVTSCTTALFSGLVGLGIGPGDMAQHLLDGLPCKRQFGIKGKEIFCVVDLGGVAAQINNKILLSRTHVC